MQHPHMQGVDGFLWARPWSLGCDRDAYAGGFVPSPIERRRRQREWNGLIDEYVEHLSFTWEFAELGERACRLDLSLDFALRNMEHVLMWEVVQEKVIAEYVRCFQRRCVTLEAATAAPAVAAPAASSS